MATAVYDVMFNVDVDIVPDPTNVPPGFHDDYDFSGTSDSTEILDASECTEIVTASGATDDADVTTYPDVREAFTLSAMPVDLFVIPPIIWHATFESSTALSVLVLEYANGFRPCTVSRNALRTCITHGRHRDISLS